MGGTLSVLIDPGYEPNLGDRIVLLSATNGISGKFAAPIDGRTAGPGLIWHVDYSNPNQVVLEVLKGQGLPVAGKAGFLLASQPVATLQGLNTSEATNLVAVVTLLSSSNDVSGGGECAVGSGIVLTTSSGTTTATVEPTLTFDLPGVYGIRTAFFASLSDYYAGQELALVDSTATVTDGVPQSLSVATGLQFTEGVPDAYDTVVATFSVPGGYYDPSTDYAATINWGGNDTTAGRVVAIGSGQFDVEDYLMHAYTGTGSHTISVTVTDLDGDSVAPATGTVSVVSQSILGWGQSHFAFRDGGSQGARLGR